MQGHAPPAAGWHYRTVQAAGLVFFLLAKSITGTLGRESAFTAKIGEGDLSQTLEISQQDEVGKLAGAKLIITGSIYAGEKNYELFLKLLRVETGEILSVTKLIVSRKLGLS